MNQRLAIDQIHSIISYFIENMVCVDQNFPSERAGTIGLSQSDISYMLRETAYSEVFKICAQNRDFHLCLLDGALVQFHYTFDTTTGNIEKHRLSYLPNPEIESYCENEDFEKEWLSDLLFSDIRKESSIQFPVRFDFDRNERIFVDNWHSKSHLTLGNLQNCRIPVSGPISPYRFIDFILRCFYSKKYRDDLDIFECPFIGESTLSENEKSLLHIGFIHEPGTRP
jgi:hypothetical protein